MKTFRNTFTALPGLVLATLGAMLAPVPRHRAQLGAIDLSDGTAVEKALVAIKEQVQEAGTKAFKEAEKAGELSTKTKEIVDKLMTDQGNLKAILDDLVQKSVRAHDEGQKAAEIDTALEKALPDLKEFMESRGMQKRVDIPMSRKALTNTGVTGTALNYPGQQVLGTPLMPLLRRLTVRDLMAPGSTDGAVIFYQRETGFTNAAAPVSEGSLKPKSEITFELITQPVRTIAHLLDISLQMLADVKFIRSYIESRMRYGLALIEEGQLLNGSGTGQNLSGVYTLATAYAPPAGATVNGAPPGGAGEQDLDKLRLAMLQVELANAFPSGIVLHPTDWTGIELLKDSTGQYLFTNPQTTTEPRMWGRPVVATQAMTQGRFLVGDFAAHTQIFDREDANVAISFENKDNFERNMATLRVEERLASAVYRPEALVKGTLESAS